MVGDVGAVVNNQIGMIVAKGPDNSLDIPVINVLRQEGIYVLDLITGDTPLHSKARDIVEEVKKQGSLPVKVGYSKDVEDGILYIDGIQQVDHSDDPYINAVLQYVNGHGEEPPFGFYAKYESTD